MSNLKEKKYINFIHQNFDKNIITYKKNLDLFLTHFAISETSFKKYYKIAQEMYAEKLDTLNESMFAKELELKTNQLQNNFATKNDLIADLESEIKQIVETIAQGYILKKIEIDGEVTEKREVFSTKEYEAWNRVLKDKRESLIRLQGYYAPDKIDMNQQVGLIDVYV